jgi:hypothetical protein
MKDDMAEQEMTNVSETETEDFTGNLSDEALDRVQGGGRFNLTGNCTGSNIVPGN